MAKKPSEGSQPETAGMKIVVSANGKAYEGRNRMTLRRCGASDHKAFCIGAHASIKCQDGLT